MSEDLERLVVGAASSSCDLDEIDYPYVSVNPSIEQLTDDHQDLDPEFKASSLLMALESSDDIQATPETCLMINKTLQEVVGDLLRIIAKEVHSIEVAKLHIVEPSSGQHGSADSALPEVTTGTAGNKNWARQERIIPNPVRCPFFQSRDLSQPPSNPDTVLRRNRGEFNVPDFRPLFWRKADNARLTRAVANDCRQRLLRSLQRDLKRKEDEYNEWLIAGPRSKQLKEEMDALSYKIAKVSRSSDETYISRPMTQEEIDRIDWMKISATDFQSVVSDENLRLVWMHQFNKTNNYGAWTREEDDALKETIVRCGCHAWEKVAEELGTRRTPFMCVQRYQQRLVPQLPTSDDPNIDLDSEPARTGPWSIEQDALLLELVEMARDEQGVIHWSFINTQVNGRSTESCRRRWMQICPQIQRGPFTEREDLQLLLAVQRYGPENFDLVAAKALPHRAPRDCRKRYGQLTCDLAQEWTYDEDRKLFLLMEKIEETYKNRISSASADSVIIPKRCYQDLLVHLPGRTWQTIRNRHRLLQSWNASYMKLRRLVCGPRGGMTEKPNSKNEGPDVVDAVDVVAAAELKRWSREEVRAVFLRTPFMLNLLEKLRSGGARSAERIKDIFAAGVTKVETLSAGESLTSSSELDAMLLDAAEGVVVPRPFQRDRWAQILRHTEQRMLLENRVRDELQQNLKMELRREASRKDPNNSNISRRTHILRVLLEDEDRFLLSMEQSLRYPDITARFQAAQSVSAYLKLVPDIVRRCFSDTQQLLSRQEREAAAAQAVVEERKNQPNARERKEERQEEEEQVEMSIADQIRQRLQAATEWRLSGRGRDYGLRNKIKRCYDIYIHKKRCTRVRDMMCWRKSPMEAFVPSNTEAKLSSEENRRKVFHLMAEALRYSVNQSEEARLREIELRGRVKLPNLPPNRCTLNAFRVLLMQRPRLLTRGRFHVEALFRVRRKTAATPEEREIMMEGMRDFVEQNHVRSRGYRGKLPRIFDRQPCAQVLEQHENIVNDPRYLLLRARVLALFMWPALLSSGKIEEYFEKLENNLMKETTQAGREGDDAVEEEIGNGAAEELKRFQNSKKRLMTNWKGRLTRQRRSMCTRDKDNKDVVLVRKRKRPTRHLQPASKRPRSQANSSWSLRSEPPAEPDLVRVEVGPTKSIVLPLAVLELMENGYLPDSYFPIDLSPSLASPPLASPPLASPPSPQPGPSRIVKEELLDE